MKKLLFGVSDTQECRQAINTIDKLFNHRNEVELTLLRVMPESIIYAESGIVDYSITENPEKIHSENMLDSFLQDFSQRGFQCKKILKSGNPIDVVLEIANDFDLLIIGASESSLLYRIFSSHQNGLVNASPIPILVAK